MFKNYLEKVDRWLENLIDRNESQMTTLHATLDPLIKFVRTLTTTNMASCTSVQWLRNFLDNACTKIQNMAFKTSKMDQIALEYWYYGFLGRLRVDGRGFLHQKPILKKSSPEQKSRCRACAEACHSPLTFLPLNVIKMFTKTRTFAEIPWRLDFSGVDCIFPYTQSEHGHNSR